MSPEPIVIANNMNIGIYLGCNYDNPENIEKQLIAWGEFLDGHHLEAFGSAKLPNSVSDSFEYYKTKRWDPENPLLKIYTALRQTYEYIQNKNPDIVIQIWCYPTHGPGVALAARSTKTPSVVRFSGDHFQEFQAFSGMEWGLAYGLHNVIGRIPLQIADKVIVLGPYGKRQVSKRGSDPKDIVILPPAAKLESRFSPPVKTESIRKDLDLPINKKIALYVGRLSKRKGMPFLLDVIDTLSDDEFCFVLVGSGEFRDEIRNKYPQSLVRTPGKVPYQEIHRYYQSADVYIHPSKYEGIPLTTLEALSCNIPVVARNAGDIGFVIDSVVDTPRDMVQLISNGLPKVEWENSDKFSNEYQKKTLIRILHSTVR
jgi:glycosyltransferase involved in cell wall biosynthesis